MQVQPFAPQVHTCGDQEEHMQQLALLFAEQQLAIQAADDVVAKESDKTLAVYQEAVNAQAAENKALQNENAVLRERLAAMENQKRKDEALRATAEKAKDARHAEEIAALEEERRKEQKVSEAFQTIVQENIEEWKKTYEGYAYDPRTGMYRAYKKVHDASVKQQELAKLGIYVKRDYN